MGRRLGEHRTSTGNGKYKKVPGRSHRAEAYSKWTEKYSGDIQYNTRWIRRNDHSTQRQGSDTHPIRSKKKNVKGIKQKEKNEKIEDSLRDYQPNICIWGIPEGEAREKEAESYWRHYG